MSLLEAINQRKSKRTYLDSPIEPDKINRIKEILQKYNQESGLSMTFIEDGSEAFKGFRNSYGLFKNVRSIMVIKGNKNDVDLKEKAGYYGEFVILEATNLGLGTCWVGGTYDKNNSLFQLTEDEQIISLVTIGNTSLSNSVKEGIIYKLVHSKVKPLEHFYKSEESAPDWFMQGIKAVQKAPSARNRQDYIFEYKAGKINAYTENTSHFDMVDLGIAKAHFVIACGGTFTFGNPGYYTK